MPKKVFSRIREFFSEERIRIAVVGSKFSGKTVFLTALADHLKHHDKETCPLNGWSVFVGDISDEPAGRDGFENFKHAQARMQILSGAWPTKTVDCSVLRLHLTLKKKTDGKKDKIRRVYLEVMDLPGERIADFPMYGKKYREWCRWFETHFRGEKGYSPNYECYCKEVLSCQDKTEAISAYKRYLAKELQAYVLSICPSIVKLDHRGVVLAPAAGDVPYKQWLDALKDKPVGLSENSQFIPLPIDMLDDPKYKTWIRDFTRGYDEYEKKILRPTTDWLDDVNQVLYFVDILGLLASGPEAYNAEQKFGEQALRIFSPDDVSRNRVVRATKTIIRSFFCTRADAVYVVVPKIDRILPPDIGNVRALAKEMFGKFLESRDIGKTNVYACASVSTTKYYEESKALKGIWKQGMEEKGYRVPPVPKKIPTDENWPVGICWPQTFPVFDKRADKAPDQKGLDELIIQMLSLGTKEKIK